MEYPETSAGDPFWEASWQRIAPELAAAYAARFDETPDAVTRCLQACGAETVCDAGCGCGAYARKLFSLGFSVSGFDLSPTAVSLARALLEESGFPDADFRACDIRSTGFPDGRFDAAVARDVLDHMSLRDASAAAAELLRIVKPGGRVLLTLDAADAEYEAEPHAVSPDGDYLYTDGRRRGMVFHPYTPESLAALFPGCAMRLLETSDTGFTAAFERNKR